MAFLLQRKILVVDHNWGNIYSFNRALSAVSEQRPSEKEFI